MDKYASSVDRKIYYHPSPNIFALPGHLLRLSVPPNWICPIRQKGKFDMPLIYPEYLSFQSPPRQLNSHELDVRSSAGITVP